MKFKQIICAIFVVLGLIFSVVLVASTSSIADKGGIKNPRAIKTTSATATPTNTVTPTSEPTITTTPTVTATPTETITATPTPSPTVTPTTTVTATPTPTPTTTLPGTTKPNSSNTGVPAGTVLKTIGSYSQPLYITVDNTILDGYHIYGDVKVQARNVVIKNSYLHCGNYIPSGNSGCIDANHGNVYNLQILNNDIHPTYPSYYRDGVVGHEYYAARNEVWGVNDGFGAFNKASLSKYTNVKIEANYIHTLVYWSNDPAHSDGTHNDGVQVQGGQNIHIIGNNLVNDGIVAINPDPAKPGAPEPHGHGCTIILQNNTNTPLVNVVVENNWIDNGLASMCIKPGTVTVRNNKFGTNQWPYLMRATGQKYVIRIDSRASTTVYGLLTNTWEDTGVFLKEGKDYGTVRAGIWYNS